LLEGDEPREGDGNLDKVFASPGAAVADIDDGASLAVGGFGVCGVPVELIGALRARGVVHLRVVSNNCGLDDFGLGDLLVAGQIDKMTSSYVGENKEFARQFLSGELEVELVPQGTLAERLRAGGAGIPAFYTATGIGTFVAHGGMPTRYAPDGSVAIVSAPKEIREFAGRPYVLEASITSDFALVRAARGDRFGNLVFHESARNFNPLCAMAGRVTIAEVEELVAPGAIDPDVVHLPGAFVQRVVTVQRPGPKRIERRMVRTRAAGEVAR